MRLTSQTPLFNDKIRDYTHKPTVQGCLQIFPRLKDVYPEQVERRRGGDWNTRHATQLPCDLHQVLTSEKGVSRAVVLLRVQFRDGDTIISSDSRY